MISKILSQTLPPNLSKDIKPPSLWNLISAGILIL
jgi:hypothetical protein